LPRVSEPTAHFIANLASGSIKLLIEPNDTFCDEVDSLLESLSGDVEMPPHIGDCAFEQPPEILVRHDRTILNARAQSNRRRPEIDSQTCPQVIEKSGSIFAKLDAN